MKITITARFYFSFLFQLVTPSQQSPHFRPTQK
uniref:Uncharacterized protein n=1 Tax=Anguilla anguilla TaxID=7936 RepID=A0A0E9S396_ANGAN